MINQTIVDAIKEKILSNIHPKAIIIFGSSAKGTATDNSDIDLFVLWDEQENVPNIKRRIYLRKIIGITEKPLDIITCSTEELQQALENQNSFTANIVKEGKLIYGRLN